MITWKKINTDQGYDKCITTEEFNMIMSEHFTARLKQANLASKNELNELSKKLKQYQQKD